MPPDLDWLAESLLDLKNIWMLTGAGISAQSGIPTYRDHQRNWQHKQPMQHKDFVSHESSRRRYWSRSMVGWPTIRDAKPNPAHLAVSLLQKSGKIHQIVTQNVDRLHSIAGNSNVIDLHGRLDKVICLECERQIGRNEYQLILERSNPGHRTVERKTLPDGDAVIDASWEDCFIVPPCQYCGGILKPDVVFYGGSVPRDRVNQAIMSLRGSEAALVVGSSISVYSALRFIKWAHSHNIPLYAINLGEMRCSELFQCIVRVPCEMALPQLAQYFQTGKTPT